MPDRVILSFSEPEAFARWLLGRPTDDAGLWVKFAKKGSGVQSISKQEAIDVALCHGWIDGQLDRFDDAHFLVKFTPRRSASKWSQNNRDRAEQLIADEAMTPRGLAEIERAKADGRWDAAYASSSKSVVPDDLQTALNANAVAQKAFEGLNRQNRFAILYRIDSAKKAETRAARIEKFVSMLARGEVIYPQK